MNIAVNCNLRKIVVILLFGLILICDDDCCEAVDSFFDTVLQKLSNDILGVQKYQDYLNLKFQQAQIIQPDPPALAQSIGNGIVSTLSGHVAALTRLNDAVSRDLRNPASYNTLSCCDFAGTSVDDRFRNSVNLSSYCTTTSRSWPSTQQFFVNTLPVLKENLRTVPTLKWQYFGGRDGSAFVYPAVNRCLTGNDPRLKPWYYMTAGGTPKDVLILIDTSLTMGYTYGSSGISKLNVAIGAAKSIVGTLIPNDRVGIISFNEIPEFPEFQNFQNAQSCYTRSLTLASTKTKGMLTDYLDHLTYKGKNPKYSPVIMEAFKAFSSSGPYQSGNSNDNRLRVVLLLTDGRSTSDRNETLCAIRQGNAQLNNSVVFMTFGIDPSMSPEQKQFLQDIAQQDFTINCNLTVQLPINPPQPGIFTQMADPDTNYVKTQIGFYYDAFANSGSRATTFSVPYSDSLGLGLVTSACQPVISSTRLLGVTCVDIALDIIFNDIINFELGQLSYAYLTDNYGRALLHPAIPRPENYESDPLLIDISYLEINDQSGYIKNSMLSGLAGSTSANANLVLNRGSSQTEGVDSFNKNARYAWYPISVMKASMCLVIVEDEGKTVKNWIGPYPPVYLAEHVNIYDLSNPLLCSRLGKASYLGGSMVKLAPKCFVDPFNYSVVNNSMNTQTSDLESFLQGTTGDIGNLSLTQGVRESVALTYALEKIWMQTTDPPDYWSYAFFRYIGTEDGVFRKYPATPMAKQYDPTRRPWYTTSVGAGQLQKITVSRPYKDTSGQILLTLGRAVFQTGGSTPSDSDPVFGVMGLDITLESFYKLLTSEFEPCLLQNSQRCLIVDNSGFVVIHRDYISSPPTSSEHISYKEPSIAYDLIQNNVMNIDTCIDYTDITNQTFWKIDIIQNKELASCTIYPVEGSNIFIIRPKDGASVPGACQCGDKNENGACNSQSTCQCPCYNDLDNSYCNGVISVTNIKRCLPPITPINVYNMKEIETQGQKLKQCTMCNIPDLFTTESQCTQRSECCWNSKMATCHSNCNKNDKVNPAAIAVPVVVGTFLLVLAIVLIICCISRRKSKRATASTIYTDFGASAQRSRNPFHRLNAFPLSRVFKNACMKGACTEADRTASPAPQSGTDTTEAPLGLIPRRESSYSSLHSTTKPTSEVKTLAPHICDSQIDEHNSKDNVRALEPCSPTTSKMKICTRACTPPTSWPNCCGLNLNDNKCPCNCHQRGRPSTILESENLIGDNNASCLPRGTEQLTDGGYMHAPDVVHSHSHQERFNGNGNTVTTNVIKVPPVIRHIQDSNDEAEDLETIPKIISESPDTIPKIIHEIYEESGAGSHLNLYTDNNIHNDNRPGIHGAFQSLQLSEHPKCCCATKSLGKQDHAENSYLSLVDDFNASSSGSLANNNCSETKRKSLGEGVIYPESICEECARGRSSVVEMTNDSLQPVSNDNSLGQLSRESSSYICTSLPQVIRISEAPDSSLSSGNGSENYV